MPTIVVSWNEALGKGRVEGQGDFKVRLNLLGQAQAWFGQKVAVLWEGYLNEPAKVRYGRDLIYPFWRSVEDDMGTSKIFTEPFEPSWEKGYTDFLKSLGYAPDSNFHGWWSKEK